MMEEEDSRRAATQWLGLEMNECCLLGEESMFATAREVKWKEYLLVPRASPGPRLKDLGVFGYGVDAAGHRPLLETTQVFVQQTASHVKESPHYLERISCILDSIFFLALRFCLQELH